MWRIITMLFLIMQATCLPITIFATQLPSPKPTEESLTSQPILPIPKVTDEAVSAHHAARQQSNALYPNASYQSVVGSSRDSGVMALPDPAALPQVSKTLSLREAIALALRYNPDVKTAELQRILDKFSLALIKKSYGVQWNPLTVTSTIQNKALPLWSAGAGASIVASTGTAVSLTHTNNLLGGSGVNTLTVTQHLLQGFGTAFNNINYKNGMDAEKVNRLTFKNSVMTVVTSVIAAYRDLVSAYNDLDTSKQSLQTQEQSEKQLALQVKAGRVAPSDLLQQQATLESTRLSVTQQEDSLRDKYQDFLSALGLISSAKIVIDRRITMNHEKLPDVARCIEIALQHNIDYQTALLNFRQIKRALITAENARKWTLDMTGSVALGAQRSVVNSPLVNQGTNPSLALSLSIPIDDLSGKQGVVSAKIDIENAELNLERKKENLIRMVQTGWRSIQNQREQIHIAEKEIQLDERNVENAKLKFQYGQTSMFEVNSLETSLRTDQINLINVKITYLNAITDFYKTLGTTLDRWRIKLRY